MLICKYLCETLIWSPQSKSPGKWKGRNEQTMWHKQQINIWETVNIISHQKRQTTICLNAVRMESRRERTRAFFPSCSGLWSKFIPWLALEPTSSRFCIYWRAAETSSIMDWRTVGSLNLPFIGIHCFINWISASGERPASRLSLHPYHPLDSVPPRLTLPPNIHLNILLMTSPPLQAQETT